MAGINQTWIQPGKYGRVNAAFCKLGDQGGQSNGLFCREELWHDAQSCRLSYLWILGRLVENLVKTWECVENMRKELIIHTNKELCLLPSASRTSPVKASNMLSLTPRGDDHGALHWYWAGGLMPPMELPVPVCSADAWTDSMAVQPCLGLQGLVRHWMRASTTGAGDPVGQKCHPCDSWLWQARELPSQVCQLKGNKGECMQEGRRDIEAWSEWAITAIKVQI